MNDITVHDITTKNVIEEPYSRWNSVKERNQKTKRSMENLEPNV